MIDCLVYGDPARCREAAAELDRQGRRLSEAEGEVTRILETSRRVWEGEAALRFGQFASGVLDAIEELKRRSYLLANALTAFADELARIRLDVV